MSDVCDVQYDVCVHVCDDDDSAGADTHTHTVQIHIHIHNPIPMPWLILLSSTPGGVACNYR